MCGTTLTTVWAQGMDAQGDADNNKGAGHERK